jgi:hypothetical protein
LNRAVRPHRLALLALSALAFAVAAAPAAALDADARYGLVKGCYDLRSEALGKPVHADAGPFFMQATGLGTYLLYGKAKTFLSAGSDGAVSAAGAPSEQGNWKVEVKGDAFTLTLPSGKALAADGTTVGDVAGAFTFVKAGGCTDYPEAPLNVTGAPSTFPTAFGAVKGILDAHMHWMAFEFLGGKAHCGRPWDPYGIQFALVDCPSHSIPGSPGNVLEAALGGPPTHDVHGWPTFTYWPSYGSLTHEGTYYRWVERAYRAGLRMFVNLYVDNEALCEIYPEKSHDCNEMSTVRLEIKRLKETQDYVDAQEGGPGKGWFRIVRTPFEARKVIAEGKLAIVQGIEVSKLLDCGLSNNTPTCTKEQVDSRLDEMYNAGVRAMELVNKFDNAFVGVAGDSGTQGIIVNTGNKLTTGQYWDMKTCEGLAPGEADKTQSTSPDQANAVIQAIYGPLVPGGSFPTYPPPPHCNAKGLTTLGTYLLDKMMAKGMIIDPDHMSVAARNATLDLIEARRYGGVVSSHSWSTPASYKRILELGGVVTPIASDAKDFVADWKLLKAERNPRYLFGFGYGADMNGFHHMGAPRPDTGNKVVYPFKSFDGKQTIDRQTTGERTWDVNKDGTAHYGLLPDWIEDGHQLAGDEFLADMGNGPEAYLQMWERAVGVPMQRPVPARTRFAAGGLGKLAVGASNEARLRAAGQPRVRGARAWRYRVQARDGRTGRVTAVLDAAGATALVASTYPEHEAAGTGPGDAAPAGARRLGSGLLAKTVKGGTFVYGTRGGKVRFVAVTRSATAQSPARLRAALKLAGLS